MASHMMTDDQQFLLLYIIGMYFGPHLRHEPKKSGLQRKYENLPEYTQEDLARTDIKTCTVERVYKYVLRGADPTMRVKHSLFRRFINGTLYSTPKTSVDQYRQFTDLFPIHMHPHGRVRDRYKNIGDIIFINNPDVSYLKEEDIEKFKSLTGLQNLELDRDEAVKKQKFGEGTSTPTAASSSSSSSSRSLKRKGPEAPSNPRQQEHLTRHSTVTPAGVLRPLVLVPDQNPSNEVQHNNNADARRLRVELTGAAKDQAPGPMVGSVEIGQSINAYIFIVTLPGVKKNSNFSCKVDAEGKVCINGISEIGVKNIKRYEENFSMQWRNQHCPPGPFTINFNLPGPVKLPNQAKISLRHGILEGIVLKQN